MNPTGGAPPDARDLLRRYDLRPKRAFSQNFLVQPSAIQEIAEATATLGREIVEFGPGLGALTYALLARGCRVTAVELDRDMVGVLRAEFAETAGLDLVQGDAAAFDLRAHAESVGDELVVSGNLPYQATGAILRHVVTHRAVVQGAVLMVQKEVRDRLIADPGQKEYGALTVFTRAAFEVDTLIRLKPGSFHPPPKVDSAVVRLRRRVPALAEETDAFRAVVRAAFHTRRKTLRNALRQVGEPEAVAAALDRAEIDPRRRGETLSIVEFGRLADAWPDPG